MNLKQAKQRIEELERKVQELEAHPPQQNHYHYHHPQYQYQPWYVGQPMWGQVPYVGGVGSGGHAIAGQGTITTATSATVGMDPYPGH